MIIMVYKDAIKILSKFECLKGSRTDKGFIIKDIVIVPADKEKRKEYINKCILNNQDDDYFFQDKTEVFIWAIDTDYLKSANILFYKDLTN